MSELIAIFTSTELVLGIITFLTSVVAAIVGVGGGMILITIFAIIFTFKCTYSSAWSHSSK